MLFCQFVSHEYIRYKMADILNRGLYSEHLMISLTAFECANAAVSVNLD